MAVIQDNRLLVAFFGAQGRDRHFVMDDTCVTPTGGQLAEAMAPLNVVLEPLGNTLTPEWVASEGQRYSVIHINWPSTFYAASDEALRRAKCRQFYQAIQAAQTGGCRIVWTMHNLFPHERPSPELDLECRRFICAHADAVIVPCANAKELLHRHFGREHGVHVIPRGHQVGLYPNTVSRAVARAELGIPPSAYVYAFFGRIRPYKGVEHLIEVFSSLPTDDARLLIAGRPATEDLYRRIALAAGRDNRVVFRPGRVPNSDVQVVLNGSDAFVAPFVEILSSASVITALSFGKPVVAPSIGCLPEIVNSYCGALYDREAPDGLRKALELVRSFDPAAVARAAAELLHQRNWPRIAELTRQVYLGN